MRDSHHATGTIPDDRPAQPGGAGRPPASIVSGGGDLTVGEKERIP